MMPSSWLLGITVMLSPKVKCKVGDLYKNILLHYITEGGELDLEHAYEFGRRAIEEGISVLQIVDAHYAALTDVVAGAGTAQESAVIAQRAGNLLKEALGAFEMTQRGYRETIDLLRSQNEKLARLLEERAQLLQQREDFMMVVTHDLKTPITATDRCLTLMLDGDFGQITPDQSDVLSTMKDSNRRMFTMVKTLLEVYKYDQSTPILCLNEVDSRSLIMSVIKEFTLSAQTRDIELNTAVTEGLHSVLADEAAIHHVLTNLIDNAIKFTPKGGVVTLLARNCNSHVIFEVSDTGKGISEEDLPKLFQRFFQSAAGRKNYTGTGLGLYLCQKIMRVHGGEIRCENQPGAGAKFIFSLPAYTDQQTGDKGDAPRT